MRDNKNNPLSRSESHRKALLKGQAKALIEHKRITTTLAKAKALQKFVAPILTKAKAKTMHAQRTVFTYFQNKKPVNTLFKELAPKLAKRPSGYTRVIRLGKRAGDNATMGIIELVDYASSKLQRSRNL